MTHRFIEGMLSKMSKGKGKFSTPSLDAAVSNLQTKTKEELAKIVDAQSELLIAQKNKIGELDDQIKELADLVNRQNAVLKQQAAVIQTLKSKSGSAKPQKVLAVAPVAPKAVPKAPAPAQRALPSKAASKDTDTGSVLDRKVKEGESSTAGFLRKLFTASR